MKNTISSCVAVLLLCLSSQPVLAEPATKIQAEYDVIGFGMTLANITETYTRTDDSYQIESVTKTVGLLARIKPETIRVSSHGKITPQGLLPFRYSLTRETDTNKNASARFNWDKNILTHTDYKGVNDMPLPLGTQDRLSLLYHLPLLLASAPTELKLSVTDGNNLETYLFNFSPKEREVTVPLGSYKTRYITNTPIGEEIKYEIWLALEQNNYPCKIIVTDSSGGKLTQVLTKLTITP
jgi:hypothetical protein